MSLESGEDLLVAVAPVVAVLSQDLVVVVVVVVVVLVLAVVALVLAVVVALAAGVGGLFVWAGVGD